MSQIQAKGCCQLIIQNLEKMQNDDFDDKNMKKSSGQAHQKMNQQTQKFNTTAMADIAFNRKDPQQKFYRESQTIQQNNSLLTRFGWKVTHLQREEEDLSLQCCNLLQSELLYPITCFTNLIESAENSPPSEASIKCLWIETSMHRLADSKQSNFKDKTSQSAKIFEFYEKKLLPLLELFIKKYINWGQMVQNGSTTQSILNAFEKLVINPANEFIMAQNKINDK